MILTSTLSKFGFFLSKGTRMPDFGFGLEMGGLQKGFTACVFFLAARPTMFRSLVAVSVLWPISSRQCASEQPVTEHIPSSSQSIQRNCCLILLAEAFWGESLATAVVGVSSACSLNSVI